MKETTNKKLVLLLILVLCLLGLSIILMDQPCVSTIDVEPKITGDNVLPSAHILNVTMDNKLVNPVFAFDDHCHSTPVYLIPNGASFTIYVQANSDGLGLAPQQTVYGTFTAPITCTVYSPVITVSATVQDTQYA